ncbi:MAG: proteasome-activating nucleotidase [Promethearchaeota archaeon]
MSTYKKREDERLKPNIKDPDDNYLLTYTRHLERRLRSLETEKQLLESERLRLDKELHSLRSELDRLRLPPLISATIIDVLPDKRVIVKSSTGPTMVVNISRAVPLKLLEPGVRVALNQRNFAVVEILPINTDPVVQGMELLENIPDVSYNDIGGLEEQIQEVRETVELPLLEPELFKKVGVVPPKGVLLFGPPGTGKTLVAKAVAHETKATFIRIIGSELVQKFIGEGARLVREIFQMARSKAPVIIFIDELDAIGSKRLQVATSGDREVQRTMMQLLSELDGFNARGDIRIMAATNRPDILDPALLRPGRFDRLIEFPPPNEEARIQIFKIHSRGMNINWKTVNFEAFAQMTEGATGADIKAICTEAGMYAIRRRSDIITKEDFVKAINKIMVKKKENRSKFELYA